MGILLLNQKESACLLSSDSRSVNPLKQTRTFYTRNRSPLSFTAIYYVLNKYETSESVLNKLRKFKIIFEICEVNEEIIDKLLNSNFKDFEDAVQHFTALQSNYPIIITRNGKDFKYCTIPFVTAEKQLSSIL